MPAKVSKIPKIKPFKPFNLSGVKNLKFVSRTGKSISGAGGKAARTIMTWGNAAKGAIVAGGGVFAYYLLQGGAVELISRLLGVSEDTAKIILLGVGLLAVGLIVSALIKRFGLDGRKTGGGRRLR